MQHSTLLINGSNLDKQKLLLLIKQNRKQEAVQFIEAATRVNAQSCQEIVENLSQNPNYYDTYNTDIAQAEGITKERESGHGKSRKYSRKGNHLISSGESESKPLIILVVAIFVGLILYLVYA